MDATGRSRPRTVSVSAQDGGTFSATPPPTVSPALLPATLPVNTVLNLTGSGTRSVAPAGYPVDLDLKITSSTQALATDNTTVQPGYSVGLAYKRPVGLLATAKLALPGTPVGSSGLNLFFTSATGGYFFNTGKNGTAVFNEEGVFTLTAP